MRQYIQGKKTGLFCHDLSVLLVGSSLGLVRWMLLVLSCKNFKGLRFFGKFESTGLQDVWVLGTVGDPYTPSPRSGRMTGVWLRVNSRFYPVSWQKGFWTREMRSLVVNHDDGHGHDHDSQSFCQDEEFYFYKYLFSSIKIRESQ